jgi:hypothetical protein
VILGTEVIGIKAYHDADLEGKGSPSYSIETSAGTSHGPYQAVVIAAPLVRNIGLKHDAPLCSQLKFEDSVSVSSRAYDLMELARPYQMTNVTFIRGRINKELLQSRGESKKELLVDGTDSVDSLLLSESAALIEVKLISFCLLSALK